MTCGHSGMPCVMTLHLTPPDGRAIEDTGKRAIWFRRQGGAQI
jgi:hypothetical protein